MAFERNWPALPPQLFTADGNLYGQIQIANTRGYKVKMSVALQATGQPNLQLQVKRVLSSTVLIVGPVKGKINERTDVSAYTVAAGAYIYAQEQEKAKVPANDRDEATYDQEPTVAWRNVLVDQLGQYYETSNPIPVKLTDGSINIETINAELRVQLSAKDNDPTAGDVHSSVRVGDGVNELLVNTDGSLNVNIVTAPAGNVAINRYAEASAVVPGVLTPLVTYTVPGSVVRSILQRVSVSGENIAKFQVLINNVVQDTRRTYFGSSLNENFEFSVGSAEGVTLLPGDVVRVTVVHTRPYLSDFEGRIQALEVNL